MYRALEQGGENMGLSVSRIALQANRAGDCGTGGVALGVAVIWICRAKSLWSNGVQKWNVDFQYMRQRTFCPLLRVGEDFSGVELAPGAQATGLCSVARAVIGSGVRKQVHYSHYSSTSLLRCLRKSVFVSPHRQRDICTSAGGGPRPFICF